MRNSSECCNFYFDNFLGKHVIFFWFSQYKTNLIKKNEKIIPSFQINLEGNESSYLTSK